VGTECTAIHLNEYALGGHLTKDRFFVRARQLPPVPDVGRLRFQVFKPAVVPAFLEVMSGGTSGRRLSTSPDNPHTNAQGPASDSSTSGQCPRRRF
jgi:hypothetical protein